ncbi:MAG: 5,10-methylenetetrahydromethanopterin reductase [Methanocellales archaeon]|nr:5,10-methylenetetrahydromethanopterin reductase [Methanocellales archaeon]
MSRNGDVVFGIEFVPDIPVDALVSHCVLAENNGFDAIWITDHYNNRSVYATLALVAKRTKQVKLGPGVTNTYHIHPALTASAIATIDEISNGRAMLGIGAGDGSTLSSLGVQINKPVARLKEAVEIIRRLLNGDRITFNGKFFVVKDAKLTFKRPNIPIYIGAQGPVMLKTAGAIGDGVLINASHPADFKYAIPKVKESAPKDFDIAAYASFSVDKNAEEARKAARPAVAFIAAGSPPEVLERHNISPADVAPVKNALARGDFRAAFSSVTDQMIDAFSIHGTPDHCIQRVKKLFDLGVTQVVVGSPIGPDVPTSIKIIGEEIIGGI